MRAGYYLSAVAFQFLIPLRMIVMTPPGAMNSKSSPPLNPAMRRIAGGTTREVPFLAIFAMVPLLYPQTVDWVNCR